MPEVRKEWKPIVIRRVRSPRAVARDISNHYFEFGQFSSGHRVGICCYDGSHAPGNEYLAIYRPSFGFGKVEIPTWVKEEGDLYENLETVSEELPKVRVVSDYNQDNDPAF